MGSRADGYGHAHRQARKIALEMFVDGTPCPLCGRPLRYYQALDLDHTVPIALGGRDGPKRLAHARCNRQRGQRLSAQRARARGSRGKQIAAIRRATASPKPAARSRTTGSNRRAW